MGDEQKRRIKELSDEDLLNMIDRDPDKYDSESLQAAKEEAEARGGVEHLYEAIGAQLADGESVDLSVGAAPVESRNHELLGGLFSDTRKLKDETISEVQFTFIRAASGNADRVTENIQKNLQAANIPLGCRWGVVEVKTKGWISRVRRDCLIVDVDEFPDYHTYISVRDFGIYLDCIRILTVEPGFVKKFLSKRLAGDPDALSEPKNILKQQDLHSWNETIRDCFKQAIDELIAELGQTPANVRSGEKKFLEIW